MINLLIVGLYRGKGARGGVVNYINLLIKHIDKDNFNTHYFSLGKSPNWYHGKNRISKMEYRLSHLVKFLSFVRFLKLNNIDTVHINSGLTRKSLFRDGILSFLAKLSGCRVLFFIHGWKDPEFDAILNSSISKKLAINLFNSQDAIGVLATQFRDKLLKLGINPKKVLITLPMVETHNYFPKDKKSKRPFKALFCANMVREKGPYQLLSAVPKVLEKFPETLFIFIGQGRDFEGLVRKTTEMRLDKNVFFSGYISLKAKTKIFKYSNVFVHPTFYGEGLPVVLLEAMAAQMPVISTPKAGIVDLIDNYKQGFLLQTIPPDSDEIASKIINLFEDPVLMKNIGENNIRKALEEYDVSVVSTQISKIYKKISVS